MADKAAFAVVVNEEEQYSVWWADRPLPAGWTAAGFSGDRDECLAHIGEVWTDMRPLSLRRHMERTES
ncbi:MbtH family protein [Salinispora arenicola]|uniref:MbtH family protein n=1 Tax=Salinispora arenicola TaxID=168697 RepID=UPI00039B2909|nr:MbtH family NRPS accessory protein [Salinispora arenicola]